jgi:hypothetical protein
VRRRLEEEEAELGFPEVLLLLKRGEGEPVDGGVGRRGAQGHSHCPIWWLRSTWKDGRRGEELPLRSRWTWAR